jgi:(p)ppGpp synthase/HD superfamily hydrolase
MNRILQAASFAAEAHIGQQRKYEGGPYINHPLRVAKHVAQFANDEDSIIAALLHDVIEDCPHVDPKLIEIRFGQTVSQYVWDLTHPPRDSGNRKQRKEAENKQLEAASAAVHTIKLADIIDNIPSIMENDKDFAPRFLQEKIDMIKILTKGNNVLFKQAFDLINYYAPKMGFEPIVIGDYGVEGGQRIH